MPLYHLLEFFAFISMAETKVSKMLGVFFGSHCVGFMLPCLLLVVLRIFWSLFAFSGLLLLQLTFSCVWHYCVNLLLNARNNYKVMWRQSFEVRHSNVNSNKRNNEKIDKYFKVVHILWQMLLLLLKLSCFVTITFVF